MLSVARGDDVPQARHVRDPGRRLMRMRRMVLLGAGASADAGLPLTNALARGLLEAVHADYRASSPEVQALNFVYGAMVNARSERGEDPLAAVNVETMVSAIRLLRHRLGHEATPFIQGWKTAVGEFGRARSSDALASDLQRGVAEAMKLRFSSGRKLQQAVEEVIDARTGLQDNADLYRDLERALLIRTRRLLLKPKSTRYLRPLLEVAARQPGGVDVATLNYDLTVETAAAEAGVPVDTGIERWVPGTPLSFDMADGRVNLVKVHGSIDWRRVPPDADAGTRRLPAERIERTDSFAPNDVPAIVLGDRDKLGGDGPTLVLLQAMQAMLQRADRLTVVGYGFADTHINQVVRDWLNADPDRTMTVLDPFWPTFEGIWPRERGGFRRELSERLASRREPWRSEAAQPTSRPRMLLLRAAASTGLAEALEADTASAPEPGFAVAMQWEDEAVATVSVTNVGPDAGKVEFSTLVRGTSGPAAELLEVEGAQVGDAGPYGRAELPQLQHGERCQLRVRYSTGPDREVGLTVTATVGVDRMLFTFRQMDADSGLMDAVFDPQVSLA